MTQKSIKLDSVFFFVFINLITDQSNLSIDLPFELFYNSANEFSKKRRRTALTDILTFYNIMSERLFLLLITKGLKPYAEQNRVHHRN